jgi:hypothetical protein
MVHKRNKYKKKNRHKKTDETIQQDVPLVDLPMHIIETIIDYCDPYTKGKCSTLNKACREFVGDARPPYVVNQHYFIRLIEELCEQKYFYLRVLTRNYHMILSDENGAVVYIDIIPRNNLRRYHKTLKRSYRIAHMTGALKSLMNGTRIFKGTDQIAGVFFRHLFQDVYDISMSTDDPPVCFKEWKESLSRHSQGNCSSI